VALTGGYALGSFAVNMFSALEIAVIQGALKVF